MSGSESDAPQPLGEGQNLDVVSIVERKLDGAGERASTWA